MPRYKHADILRAVADAAESSETPWDVVEYKKYKTIHECRWLPVVDMEDLAGFMDNTGELRIRPKTRIINGRECPEALRVAPKVGADVWIEHPSSREYFMRDVWRSTESLKLALARGIVHLCKENAVICCKARLGEGE